MKSDYAGGALLGAGAYGTVFEVAGADGKKMAVKVGDVGAYECDFQKLVYDDTMLAPDVYEYGKNYILMELIEGETLKKWIKNVNDPSILIASLAGLAALYETLRGVGIAHEDLHGSNIIVTNDGWRVIDYGHAKKGAMGWEAIYGAVSAVARHIILLYPAMGHIRGWNDGYKNFLEYIKAIKEYFAAYAQASESYTLAHLLRGLLG